MMKLKMVKIDGRQSISKIDDSQIILSLINCRTAITAVNLKAISVSVISAEPPHPSTMRFSVVGLLKVRIGVLMYTLRNIELHNTLPGDILHHHVNGAFSHRHSEAPLEAHLAGVMIPMTRCLHAAVTGRLLVSAIS